MAKKLDKTLPLFLGEKPTRESTVFGQMRKAVWELGQGAAVTYADMEAHMLANFQPAKTAKYDAAYIAAYARDAVGKFGYLSHEDGGHEYTVTAEAEKKPAAEKPKKLSKAEQEGIALLKVIKTRGEVDDVSLINSSQVDVDAVVTETKKKSKTVQKIAASLVEKGLLRMETSGEATYLYLTEAGFEAVNGSAEAAE
jgi:predicted transcriptional regulator